MWQFVKEAREIPGGGRLDVERQMAVSIETSPVSKGNQGKVPKQGKVVIEVVD